MDPKVIEMNNLRVLNDYLNQTLDVIARGQRHGHGYGYNPFGGAPFGGAGFGGAGFGGAGFSGAGFGGAPFGGAGFGAGPAAGTDVVYGASPYGAAYPQMFGGFPAAPFGGQNPFGGFPMMGAGYGPFGAWQQPWGQGAWQQGPWTAGQPSWPVAEAARQAQFTQALAAKQSVLEAMCRMAGIPV